MTRRNVTILHVLLLIMETFAICSSHKFERGNCYLAEIKIKANNNSKKNGVDSMHINGEKYDKTFINTRI